MASPEQPQSRSSSCRRGGGPGQDWHSDWQCGELLCVTTLTYDLTCMYATLHLQVCHLQIRHILSLLHFFDYV